MRLEVAFSPSVLHYSPMKPSAPTVIFFCLALFATFVSKATHINGLVLYLVPIAVVLGLLFAYGAIALKPITVLLSVAGLFWWMR